MRAQAILQPLTFNNCLDQLEKLWGLHKPKKSDLQPQRQSNEQQHCVDQLEKQLYATKHLHSNGQIQLYNYANNETDKERKIKYKSAAQLKDKRNTKHLKENLETNKTLPASNQFKLT